MAWALAFTSTKGHIIFFGVKGTTIYALQTLLAVALVSYPSLCIASPI